MNRQCAHLTMKGMNEILRNLNSEGRVLNGVIPAKVTKQAYADRDEEIIHCMGDHNALFNLPSSPTCQIRPRDITALRKRIQSFEGFKV